MINLSIRGNVTDDNIRLRLENKVYHLDIDAERSESVELHAPRLGEMTAKFNESLYSSINAALLKKTGPGTKIIYSETGRNIGLELVGDVEELTKRLKKPVLGVNEYLIVIHLNWIGLKTSK